HMGRHQLVVKARRAGAPICGVTISAGIPEVDEAVALLDQLASEGIWLNAFKPGTLAQVGSVLKIAQAAPQHTIFLHLEGGLAGGHHSWEALEELLLGTYAKIREHDNVMVCVGGGIGTPERAEEMLRGTWARAYGQFDMPVDAILLGTVTMAVQEAKTSLSVKQALVDAAGFEGWVYAGDAKGDVTSGKSGLNADIHYLDNPAARCGRLLDEVAGDAEAIASRRDEIVGALNATAKPYFGDVTSMTYAEVIERMNELMAIGDPASPYEDGRYKDVTWRARVLDALRRFEARLSELEEGAFPSIFARATSLDDPEAALARFVEAYPCAATLRTSPLDADWFVQSCCARPGKPVPFVPVIDEDVRRWYKSDSLWQAHDERFTADQVLTIPGPQAVAGITRVDEPVAELLARFERASVDALVALNGQGAPRTILGRRQPTPADVRTLECALNETTYSCVGFESAASWLDAIASHYSGAIASFMAEPNVVEGERFVTNPLRRVCVPEEGASIAVSAQKGQAITRLRFKTPTSAQDVVVEAQEQDEHHEISVSIGAPGAAERTARFSVTYRTLAGDGLVRFVAGAQAYTSEVRRFYFDALFGEQRSYVELFEESSRQVTFDAKEAYAYSAITADAVGSAPPLSYAF
ncbi:MAG: fatty acid synthase subunit beta domain-containing protein, partial [Myxococcota bacterium]